MVIPITQIRAPNCKGMLLTLAWAITISKAQRRTLDRITVDLGRKVFPSGLTALVALSLVKPVHGSRLHSFDFDRCNVL